MRWIAGPMLWLSIFGVIALLMFGANILMLYYLYVTNLFSGHAAIYYSVSEYIRLKENPNSVERPNSVTNLSNLADNYLQKSTTWLVLLIIATILLAIILLVLLVLRTRIIIAIALVKEASK